MGRLFTYCRISCQIAVLGLCGVVGMAVIGALGWWSADQTAATNAAVAQAQHTVRLQDQLQIDMLQARRHEKDMLLRRDEASANKHAGAMAAIGRDLAALRAAASTQPEALAPLERIATALERYGAQFTRMAGLMREIGLNENQGLQGALRGAIREVEQRMTRIEALPAQVSILMIRRHEKDYLARDEARYVTAVEGELVRLLATLDAAGLAEAERAELGTRIETYRAAFLRLVAARGQLTEATKQLSAAYAEVETQAETVEALFLRVAETQTAAGVAQVRAVEQQGLALGALVALMVAGMSWWIGRGISRPVVAVTRAMQGLAAGRLDTALPQDARHDELGQMMRTLVSFRDGLAEAEQLRGEQAAEREAAAAQKVASLRAMADKIEEDAGAAVARIDAQAAAMVRVAGEMRRIAEGSGTSAAAASEASDAAQANAQTVASATEQLSASIREIGAQVAQSTQVVTRAVEATDETRTVIGQLSTRVAEIGAVADMIGEIAGRTNLLALNATIEAARAGEAGKGFAVVASEVKALATQTARSTEEITRHIAGVRAATDGAAAAMARIESTIGQVNGIATSIASAVEEQGAATAEIARAVNETSATVDTMAQRNTEVANDAARTGDYATQVEDCSGALTGALDELRRAMVHTVRTAAAEVDRRSSPRFPVSLGGRLDLGQGAHTVQVAELSEGGARIAGATEHAFGRRGMLAIDGAGRFEVVSLGLDGDNLRLAFKGGDESRAPLRALLARLEPQAAAA